MSPSHQAKEISTICAMPLAEKDLNYLRYWDAMVCCDVQNCMTSMDQRTDESQPKRTLVRIWF